MSLVELSVITTTSYGKAQSSAYIVVLEDKAATKRLPIIIGVYEGHFIELAMIHAIPPRPLTHDLFVNFIKATRSTLQDVFIYKFSESVFYSRLNFLNERGEPFSVDARTSDAIAIALRCEAPIFTTEEIMDVAGIPISELAEEGGGEEIVDVFEEAEEMEPLPFFTDDELEEFMQSAIEQEDYEKASQIRDEIQQRKRKRGEE